MTTGVTKAWVAAQATKASAPILEGWKNGALTGFVHGAPANLKNKVSHWSTRARWAKSWRERTANALLPWRVGAGPIGPWPWSPYDPKRIHFTVFCRNPFDSAENLRLVCSAVKDALGPSGARKVGVGIIDDDRDSSGHVFTYEQITSRKAGAVFGIAIRIALAKGAE